MEVMTESRTAGGAFRAKGPKSLWDKHMAPDDGDGPVEDAARAPSDDVPVKAAGPVVPGSRKASQQVGGVRPLTLRTDRVRRRPAAPVRPTPSAVSKDTGRRRAPSLRRSGGTGPFSSTWCSLTSYQVRTRITSRSW
ncbi:hypothetical protein Sxan_53460 [Streptomyces xanthophaeus]|uniref:Uncharacterized protein n=1 Tax=Streptomyces xanthophaeus TaxID=67385 RepID=A0A919H2P5_9ACTN|nr:hypothetical protein Sxan_53460 [Streptomyces xanthophaeus]